MQRLPGDRKDRLPLCRGRLRPRAAESVLTVASRTLFLARSLLLTRGGNITLFCSERWMVVFSCKDAILSRWLQCRGSGVKSLRMRGPAGIGTAWGI